MADSRLNSIHLEADRRLDFRRAREGLLAARGPHTLALESGEVPCLPPAGTNLNLTAYGSDDCALGLVRFVLMDRDYVYPLKTGLNTVGRMPDNDVVVQDPFVSRRHCAILVHAGDGCEVHDVASKNGTFVNGRRIDGPTLLQSGDEIRMCGKNLVFLTRGEEKEPPGHHTTRME